MIVIVRKKIYQVTFKLNKDILRKMVLLYQMTKKKMKNTYRKKRMMKRKLPHQQTMLRRMVWDKKVK